MNPVLKSLIAFLYPAQCRHCGENLDPGEGHYICATCWREIEAIQSPHCQRCGYPFPGASTSPYLCKWCLKDMHFRKARAAVRSGLVVRGAINLLKFQSKTVMAKRLSHFMIEAMPRLLGTDYDLIIPVPLHKKDRRKRGYNQVEILGRRLSKATGIPMDTKALVKTRNTPRQSEARFRSLNVQGSFGVPDPSRVRDKRILLIDDEYVSGSTVNEASSTLEEANVRYVDVFTLARRVEVYPSMNALEEWLRDYFETLPLDAQRSLEILRSGYDGTGRPVDGDYGDDWSAFSRRMRAERRQCEVCGGPAEHVHHRHYRTLGREKPADVVVLCAMCHCFIHPTAKTTIRAFERTMGQDGGERIV